MTNTFRRYGVDARFITSKTQTADRHNLIQQFRNREYPVLVNCGIFTEGTDIPNIDCVLLARPTRSRNLIVQMIGRGMRLSPGKKDCHVIDMIGSIKTHGVVTTPSLFGLDPNEIVSEESADGLRERAEEWKKIREIEQEEAIRNGTLPWGIPLTLDPMLAGIARSITYTDWESVQSLLDDVTDLHIRQLSRLAWVYVGEYKHILSIPRHGFLRVDRAEDGTFYCTETREIPSFKVNPVTNKHNIIHAAPRILFDSLPDLPHAIAAADTYASSHFPTSLISRLAMWRNGAATVEQIKFVNKFKPEGYKYDLPGEHRTGRSLTKGAAGDFITRVRHGGKAIFEKTKAKGRKMVREMERLEKLRQAETVQVGAIA
jgi:ATP-dependent helicase IRC3